VDMGLTSVYDQRKNERVEVDMSGTLGEEQGWQGGRISHHQVCKGRFG
jgi:hypothetical protein